MSENAGPAKVTISIINWNSWEETLGCLAAVEKLSYRPLRLVVIDNGSVDHSARRLKRWASEGGGFPSEKVPDRTGFAEPVPQPRERCVALRYPGVTLLLADDNYGFPGGNNLSIAWALDSEDPPDYVFLHNNDARPQPDMIDKAVSVAEASLAGVVGVVVKDPDTGAVKFAGARLPQELFWGGRVTEQEQRGVFYDVDRVEGSGMMIRRDCLEARKAELGHYLDERLFLYCDEMEFGAWAARRGYRTVMAREAVMHHAESVAFGGNDSPVPKYYFTRNKMYVARRYLGLLPRLAYEAWYGPAMLYRTAQRLAKGRPDLARATLTGMLHGFVGVTGKHDVIERG